MLEASGCRWAELSTGLLHAGAPVPEDPPMTPSQARERDAAGWDDTDSPLVGRRAQLLPSDRERLVRVGLTMPAPYAFSHATAAAVFGWPVPWAARVTGDVHVMTPTTRGRIRRPGLVAHRGLESRTVIDVDGIPVVAPPDTWADLGELSVSGGAYGFQDLVVSADQALNCGCTRAELAGILDARRAARGVRNLGPALAWARRGAESGGESVFRLVMHRVGLPLPLLNKNVFDTDGRWLFRPDMGWRARRVAVEYQGAEWHDRPDAVAADERRFDRGDANGWTFIAVRSAQVRVKEYRDAALLEIADALGYPAHRLDLDAGEPQRFSALYATTLMENLERRRRRQRAHDVTA